MICAIYVLYDIKLINLNKVRIQVKQTFIKMKH